MKKKIVVFGAGKIALKAIPRLIMDYEIIAILDNNPELWGSLFCGIPVKKPDSVEKEKIDDIVITSVFWKEMLRQLFEKWHVEKAKVFQWQQLEGKEECEQYCLKEASGAPLYRECAYKEKVSHKRYRKNRNSNNYKNVLFLAYYFPPLGSSPVQRTLKFVKYLERMGYHTIVLTVDDSSKAVRDDSLLNEIPESVEVVRFPDLYDQLEFVTAQQQQDIFNLICNIDHSEAFISEWIEAQKDQEGYILPDKLILWAAEVYKHIEKFVDMSKIGIIYSTVPEWSPHLLGYCLKQKYGIPWVGDYRDPWVASQEYVDAIYPYMKKKEIFWEQKIEQVLLKQMNAVVVAGDNWKPLFEEKYHVPENKITVISNGYDEEDFINIHIRQSKNEKFTLCYNGSIGYNRKPRIVLEVITELIKEGVIEKEKIQWIFNGPVWGRLYEQEIEKYDLFHIVKSNGILPHIESIQSAMNADVMVIYGEIGDMAKLNYPGKFYEYLRIGRPILCFSSLGSPQDAILHETNMGRNYDLEDRIGVRDYLIRMYKKWETDGANNIVYYDIIQKFSREKLTEALASIFVEVWETCRNNY